MNLINYIAQAINESPDQMAGFYRDPAMADHPQAGNMLILESLSKCEKCGCFCHTVGFKVPLTIPNATEEQIDKFMEDRGVEKVPANLPNIGWSDRFDGAVCDKCG